MNKVGRPSKYNERMINRNFYIPDSIFASLEENVKSGKFKSMNEALIYRLVSSDSDLASRLSSWIDGQNTLLKKLSESTSEQSKLLEKLASERNICDLFSTPSDNPLIGEVIEENRIAYLNLIKESGEIPLADKRESFANKLVEQIKIKLSPTGQIVDNERLLHKIIVSKLMRLDNGAKVGIIYQDS